MKERLLRVGEQVRHCLAQMLSQGNVFIPGLKASQLMVTEVQMTSDLGLATVRVRAFQDDTAEQVGLLNAHRGLFRKEVARQVKLRIVPQLIFRTDDRFEEAVKIADLLAQPQVQKDVEKYRKKTQTRGKK